MPEINDLINHDFERYQILSDKVKITALKVKEGRYCPCILEERNKSLSISEVQ